MAREDLTGRGQKGGVYRSGSFAKAKKRGAKTANLTKKDLSRAQTARGKKVSQRQVTKATKKTARANISETQFEKGRGVTRNGKLFTGTVKLASGKRATYVRGRRVVAGKKSTAAGRGGSGGRGGATATAKTTKPGTTRVTPSERGEGSGASKPTGGTSRGYVHDSFMASQPVRRLNALQKANLYGVSGNPYGLKKSGAKAASNKKTRGEKTQLRKGKDGNFRWVKVV